MKSPVDNSTFRSATDLQQLGKLRSDARSKDPKALEAVAKQFESLFLNMLLQNMRKANEALGGDDLFSSSQTKFYQGMLDQQLGLNMAQGKGIGLSEVLVRQLSKQQSAETVDPQVLEARQSFDRALEQTARAAVEALMQGEDSTATTQTAPSNPTELPERFASPDQFVAVLNPVAEKVAEAAGVDPRVLLAQSALETGWGQHLPRKSDGSNSYNLFGIKADSRWQGDRVLVNTLEFRDGVAQQEKAAFRAYGSYEESMWDYLDFLRQSPRYEQALNQGRDGEAYLQQLQLAGYATDPAYAEKITGILNGDVLQSALERLKDS
ncbi:flagellar assembly peptidoglycan hydrolase FlgJ [Motiliproteus sediminis]|uniref:flagellar assembly peptidoglycan hydrolase FlgJ n=1 Tax=Motiliproteus sediminis TaxID=1468178 RepID=UPI001AEF7539|nr:flagellar assembly peptidoglycan hydrolase FlgJ [Motiliproteus sediminis]